MKRLLLAFLLFSSPVLAEKERGIVCLYKGVKKDDPTSVILIEQGEEGKSISMFEDPAVKPLIELSLIHI